MAKRRYRRRRQRLDVDGTVLSRRQELSPTPEEIQRLTAEIRASWDEQTEIYRRRGRLAPYTIPTDVRIESPQDDSNGEL